MITIMLIKSYSKSMTVKDRIILIAMTGLKVKVKYFSSRIYSLNNYFFSHSIYKKKIWKIKYAIVNTCIYISHYLRKS